MENFIQEIIQVCKLPFNELIQDYKIIQLGNRAIYISNFKKVIDYSIEKIVLKLKKGVLEVIGRDLYICQINSGEIIIKGCIESFGMGVNHENKKN